MCTLNKNCNLIAKSFGPEGCQVPVGKGICGETRTLQIINEFKRLYEEKMNQIDAQAGGDCLQEKFKLQQEWIGDLTDQNEMLVRAVEELEYEATERVKMLEEKLQHSAQCICEVMKRYREHDVTSDLLAEPLQKVFELENDKINLLEFIKRIRESGKWTIDGLKFYEINYDDLLGTKKINEVGGYVQGRNVLPNDENEDLLSARDKLISELQGKVNYYDSFGNIDSLAKDLKCKTQECESLRQSMVDMRQALTEEVAAKHDIILALKKDCQQLEERCMQADKQTAFKDDIIKELRKEIKQLKQQIKTDELSHLNETIEELRRKLHETETRQEHEERVCKICKGRSKVGFVDAPNVCIENVEEMSHLEQRLLLMQNKEETIKLQNDTLKSIQLELQALKDKENETKIICERKQEEIQCLKSRILELEDCLQDAQRQSANLQLAVDLYLNSINVLEAAEEKSKLEIQQQKATIANLQDALVAAKHDLDELRQKTEDNVSFGWAARWLGTSASKSTNNSNKSVHDI